MIKSKVNLFDGSFDVSEISEMLLKDFSKEEAVADLQNEINKLNRDLQINGYTPDDLRMMKRMTGALKMLQ